MCVCVGTRGRRARVCVCVIVCERALIGTELIKSVFERVNCEAHDLYRRVDAIRVAIMLASRQCCCVSDKYTNVRFFA